MTAPARKPEFSGVFTEMPCGCRFDTPWEGQVTWNVHERTCSEHRDFVDFSEFKKAMRAPEDPNARRIVRGFDERFLAEMRAGYATLGNRIPTRGALLLTTIGAKSGADRTTPLGFERIGSTISLIATNGGQDRHPAWYHNLLANPEVTLEIANHTFTARAHEALGKERDYRIAASAVARPTRVSTWERATRNPRLFPIIVLTPERDDLPYDDELLDGGYGHIRTV